MTTPPAPRSAQDFDRWHATRASSPLVADVINRNLGLPPGLLAGMVPACGIGEFIAELRLAPGDVLADLACGSGGYGLQVARATGARVAGLDFSAQAIAIAREQAARLGVAGAAYQVGDLTACGLADGSADAALCTDSVQFAAEPDLGYREMYRILRPGGRVLLTCWQASGVADDRLSPLLRRVDLAGGLAGAGFTAISVAGRPGWRARERAVWEAAIALDGGDDLAVAAFRQEAAGSLQRFGLLDRVRAVAVKPAR